MELRLRRFSSAVAVALVLVSASAAVAATSGWSIESTPKPTRGGFGGVACTSARACVAVGSNAKKGPYLETLAERPNGSRWSVQPTPNPPRSEGSVLRSVACTSQRTCIAVGSYTTNQSRSLTLAERWNGTKWTIAHTPNPKTAMGVSGVLSGVSCTSASACTAVGSYPAVCPGCPSYDNSFTRTLAERWNGSRWSIQHTPNPGAARGLSELNGVSCASKTACTAVGYHYNGNTNVTLAEHWNGSNWRVQHTANPAGARIDYLDGVSCAAARACVAVGTYANRRFSSEALAERWNGSKWSIRHTPTPTGAHYNELYSVSCTAAGACTAVGDYTKYNHGRTLALRWNGTKWSLQRTPNPAGASGADLFGVACTSKIACTAVGDSRIQGSKAPPLAERWNGG